MQDAGYKIQGGNEVRLAPCIMDLASCIMSLRNYGVL